MTAATVRRPVRHACSGCGACCQGSVVHLPTEAEQARVRAQAEALGVDDPVEDGHLRIEQGRCVFLDGDRRCRIHARFGEADKPLVCRQFPFAIVQTEDGLRAGIDPASTAWRTTRHDGPALTPPAGVTPRQAPLPPPQAAVEGRLVALCAVPDARLADLLALLCAAPDAPPALPAGFAARWLQTVRAAPLAELLHHPAVGPDHRAVLLPILEGATEHDPEALAGLPDALQRDTLDLIGDTLWLRLLATRIPLVQATALLLAGGALLSAWHDPRPDAHGLALATWCRLLRAGPFWQSMVRTPAHLQWLATGQGAPPG